jgi:hypothetical protein
VQHAHDLRGVDEGLRNERLAVIEKARRGVRRRPYITFPIIAVAETKQSLDVMQ